VNSKKFWKDVRAERKEHPWATEKMAERIVKDHLRQKK